MKFIATKNLGFWLLLIALCLQPLYAKGENSCDCLDPPGGRITCESDQIAICRAKDGKVYGECISHNRFPPKSVSGGVDLKAWILSELLQTSVRPEDVERRPDYQRILSEGRYTNPKTGEVIRFQLPRSW